VSPRRRRGQRGQETLQAILAVSFMLLPVLLGIVELGGLIHLWIGQESAAAAGARAAGERGEDDAFVRTRIALSLRESGIDPGRVRVEVVPASVGWGQPITVHLVSRRRLAIPFLLSRDVTLTTAAVARGEVDH
jgi:hypothetical protein